MIVAVADAEFEALLVVEEALSTMFDGAVPSVILKR